MLELLTNVICSTMMTILGFYVIKSVTKSEVKFFSGRTIILILILDIIELLLHKIQYTMLYTIIVFCLNITIYKQIFKIGVDDSIASSGILMIVIFISDLIVSFILMNFFDVDKIRSCWYLYLTSNIFVIFISIGIFRIKKIKRSLQNFYTNVKIKKSISNITYLSLMILLTSIITYNISMNFTWNYDSIINIITIVCFLILILIYIIDKNNYSKLTAEYDNLFNYVQTFEDWIEKEQLNRHEYKNQLAVLRCMAKDKNIISKIDEILEDSINVEGEVANQLKTLPKGGIKGLMYYKSSIAQKKKVKLTVDVSLERHSLLEKLTEKDMRILCKLIGIYFDNAIEAALETRKKVVCVEIYELNDHVSFVISNTFKQHKNMDRRNEKGVSSKGEGHGNGLYFASKLISKNVWLTQKQEIIDKYYIQTLVIKKPDTK